LPTLQYSIQCSQNKAHGVPILLDNKKADLPAFVA
jgi:hypothetical protein